MKGEGVGKGEGEGAGGVSLVLTESIRMFTFLLKVWLY